MYNQNSDFLPINKTPTAKVGVVFIEIASDASKRLCQVLRHTVKNSLKSSSLMILISFVELASI